MRAIHNSAMCDLYNEFVSYTRYKGYVRNGVTYKLTEPYEAPSQRLP